tara:strand:+ start:505 stop:948 length:444 start_codon:yes stop_codon:yes gene_type:complete
MNYTYLNITNTVEIAIWNKLVSPNTIIGKSADYEIEETVYESYPLKIKSLSLCNVHASDSVSVDLYSRITIVNQSNDVSEGEHNPDNTLDVIDDTSISYYLLKNVVIPKGVTLKLTEEDVCHDSTYYDLYLKLSASDSAVDVVIKHY